MKYIFRKKINGVAAACLDALGYPAAGLFRKGGTTQAIRPSQHILVIRLDHLGDILPATAIPKVMKENFPARRVTFLTTAAGASLLENNPFVDEVITYEAPWFAKQARLARRGKLKFFELARVLKEKKIDLGLGLRGDLRENILMAVAGIRNRVGYGITGGGFFLTKELAYRRAVHENEHTMDLLRALGVQIHSLKPQIYFSETEKTLLENRLSSWGFREGEKVVGFQVSAGTPAKDWEIKNIRQFLFDFKNQFPEHRLAFVGSNAERMRQISEGGAAAGLDLVGKTTLRELCFLMKKIQFFIGPDSGPAHIASAMGVPTLFLYSGTNVFEEWRPLGEHAQMLRHSVPCSPCGLRLCPVKGHPCMSLISHREVMDVLENSLRS